MKFKIPLICLMLSGMAACSNATRAPDAPPNLDAKLKEGKTIASLGGAELHEGFFVVLTNLNPNIQGQIKSPAGKKRLVDSLLEQEVFYRESIKRGLDKNPAVQEKAAIYQRMIISQALLDEEVKKRAKGYYEKNKETEFSRIKLAHLLIRPKPPTPTKAGEKPPKIDQAAMDAAAKKRAEEAKQKLDGGMAWEEAVTIYSDDPVTKNKGGDLGMISRQDRRIQRLGWDEVVTKAFSMKVGEISAPLKAKDGYHIVKLLEAPTVAPYEEVQTSIEFKLRGQVKTELLADLTGGETVEYQEGELKDLSGPKGDKPAEKRPAPGGIQAQPANPKKVPVSEPKAP